MWIGESARVVRTYPTRSTSFIGEADIAGDEDEKEREKEGRKRGRLSADKDFGLGSSMFGMGEVTRNLRNISALKETRQTIGASHVCRSE